MSQQDPIDYVDEPEVSVDDVNRRVEDWLRRLDRLFKEVKTWAATNGWSAEDRAPIPMHEELMKKTGVPRTDQPSLAVKSPDGVEILIKPKGLWVIGANGRVDIFSRAGVFTLVDVAENFEEPSWVLHRVSGERQGQSFEPRLLAGMV